jgi:hypothetical protein
LPWADVLTVSRNELVERWDLLNELGAQANVFDVRANHPWRGFSATAVTITERERIEEDLRLLLSAANRIQKLIACFRSVVEADDFSISDLLQLQPAFSSVAALDRLPRGWFEIKPGQLEERAKLFETAAAHQKEFESQLAAYKNHFELPLEQAASLLSPATRQFLRGYRSLLPSYWRWRSAVKRHAKTGTRITHSVAVSLHGIVCRLVELDNWFQSHQKGLCVEAETSEIRDKNSLLQAAQRCRVGAMLKSILLTTKKEAAQSTEITDSFRRATVELPTILSEGLRHSVERLDRLWPLGFATDAVAESTGSKQVINRTSELLCNFALFQEWVVLQRSLQKCNGAGLGSFLTGLGSTSAKDAADAFGRRFYQLWISSVMAQSDALMMFSPAQREELVKKFESLDKSVRALVALHIQGKAADAARRLRAAQSSISGSEVGVLRRELQKRKRIKPLRKLFAEIPHALQALKPCMLMSPISVSTYLKPGSVTFDLVVFDEASQLPTPEGIPGLTPAFGVCGAAVASAHIAAPSPTSGTNKTQPGAPVAGSLCSVGVGNLSCDSEGDLLDCSQVSSSNPTTQWTLLQQNSPSCTGYNPGTGTSSGNSSTTCATSGLPTWHEFYYGSDGRLLEEFEYNGACALWCPAYDLTDHVYFANQEVARVVRQFQSQAYGTSAETCALNPYQFVDMDILYLHHDARGALVAAESSVKEGLAWEAEISPFGQVMHVGLPGADGKIGTSDDIQYPDPRVTTLTSGVAAASPDGQLGGFLDQPGEIDPSAGRSIVPGSNVWSMDGASAYTPTSTPSGPGGVGSGDAGFGSGPMGMLMALALGAPTPGGGGPETVNSPMAKRLVDTGLGVGGWMKAAAGVAKYTAERGWYAPSVNNRLLALAPDLDVLGNSLILGFLPLKVFQLWAVSGDTGVGNGWQDECVAGSGQCTAGLTPGVSGNSMPGGLSPNTEIENVSSDFSPSFTSSATLGLADTDQDTGYTPSATLGLADADQNSGYTPSASLGFETGYSPSDLNFGFTVTTPPQQIYPPPPTECQDDPNCGPTIPPPN